MNGIDGFVLPKFLEGQPLPANYFDPVDPYADAPTCNFRVGDLVDYARSKGKKCWDLTKEEIDRFQTV